MIRLFTVLGTRRAGVTLRKSRLMAISDSLRVASKFLVVVDRYFWSGLLGCLRTFSKGWCQVAAFVLSALVRLRFHCGYLPIPHLRSVKWKTMQQPFFDFHISVKEKQLLLVWMKHSYDSGIAHLITPRRWAASNFFERSWSARRHFCRWPAYIFLH